MIIDKELEELMATFCSLEWDSHTIKALLAHREAVKTYMDVCKNRNDSEWLQQDRVEKAKHAVQYAAEYYVDCLADVIREAKQV